MIQISGLSSALNITFDKFAPSSEVPQKYLFESFSDVVDCSDFKDCECSVERLLVKKHQICDYTSVVKTFYINAEDNLNSHKNFENTSHITNSLTSIKLLHEDLNYTSETDFSYNVEVLDFHENTEKNNGFISSRNLEKIFSPGMVLNCF